MFFFQVLRIFFDASGRHHSVEYFENEDASVSLFNAQKRYFNIIAADLANANITYNAAYIIDSTGQIREWRVFDRRTVNAEEGEE